MSEFTLNIVKPSPNFIHKSDQNGFKHYATAGMLSSTGGGFLLYAILGKNFLVDPGDCMTPIIFKMKDEDVEPIRQLLEERLNQIGNEFDCFKSALICTNQYMR